MSSIRLLKEHEGNAKGAIVSVPFVKGKELLAAGIGVYLDQGAPAKPKETGVEAELDRLRRQAKEQQELIENQQRKIDILSAPPVPKQEAKK